MASPICFCLYFTGIRTWIGVTFMSINVFVSWVHCSPNALLSDKSIMTTRNEMKSDPM